MRLLRALLICLAIWGHGAAAQDLPEWTSTTVNDFAAIITPADEDAISRALQELRNTTGIEGTVVTLPDRARHGGSDGLESFATRLFNHWGVGDAARNDGFMILVLAAEREARIELGAAYPTETDIRAQDIVRNTMLPAFREGRMSQGLRDGTDAAIALIAQPWAQRLPPAAKPAANWADRAISFAFFGAFATIFAAILRKAWRRRQCPQCGKGGLTATRQPHRIPQSEGGAMIDSTELRRHCPHCLWSETRLIPRPERVFLDRDDRIIRRERNPDHRRSRRGGDSGFGGGSSRGGGASGRW